MLLLPNASSLYTQHISQENSGGLSPSLWRHMTTGTAAPDGNGGGLWFGDDFDKFAGLTAAGGNLTFPDATGLTIGGYHGYVDATGSILSLAGVTGGGVRITTHTTNADNVTMSTGELLQVSDTAGDEKLTIFECRVAWPQVATGSTYIGLADPVAKVILGVTHTDLINTASGIGFMVKDAASSTLDFVYQATASTATTDGMAALVVEPTIAGSTTTLVATTYYKLGFIYNPRAEPAKRIAIYVDNVEQSTYVTATQISNAVFPDAEYMGLQASCVGDGAVRTMDIDWWAIYQEG